MPRYRQDLSGCFSPSTSLDRSLFDTALIDAQKPLDALKRQYDDASLTLLQLPEARDDLDPAREIAADFRTRLDTILVLGTGGSSLGGKTLADLAEVGISGPELIFLDNVDPRTFARLQTRYDPAGTGLLAISKSGSTVETLTQLTALVPWLAAAKPAALMASDLVAITQAGDNPLRGMARHLGARILDHDGQLGGRYSCLSIVGLLPAMIAGLDPVEIRAGAAAVLHDCLTAKAAQDCAPLAGAAMAVALARQGINMAVLMPYLDRLENFARWHRQLWAESLGKQGLGTTPIDARGTVDQHSQLQLYLDGPADKYFTLVAGDPRGAAPLDGELLKIAGSLDYLRARSVGDVLAASQEATIDSLIAVGRPTRVLRLTGTGDGLDAQTMGGLMMHFMLETIIAAGLFDVDPFDQPAVEAGKQRARDYLGNMSDLAAKIGPG